MLLKKITWRFFSPFVLLIFLLLLSFTGCSPGNQKRADLFGLRKNERVESEREAWNETNAVLKLLHSVRFNVILSNAWKHEMATMLCIWILAEWTNERWTVPYANHIFQPKKNRNSAKEYFVRIKRSRAIFCLVYLPALNIFRSWVSQKNTHKPKKNVIYFIWFFICFSVLHLKVDSFIAHAVHHAKKNFRK